MLLSTRTTIRGKKKEKGLALEERLVVAPLSVSRRRLGSLLQCACWALVEKEQKRTIIDKAVSQYIRVWVYT
jgi:hypothetical protein